MIGALLRQERNNASLSIKALTQETGISGARIKAYELGEKPISVPELEALLTALGGRIDTFFDQSGPIVSFMPIFMVGVVFGLAMIVVLGSLSARLFYMQVISAGDYAALAEGNRSVANDASSSAASAGSLARTVRSTCSKVM